MKNITKTLLRAVLALCLVLCLCACGSKQTANAKLEGTYVLSKLTYADGTTLTGDELKTEFEEGWGMDLEDNYLELHSDGTGVLCVYGLPQEIAFADGKFWYSEFLDLSIGVEEDVLEFDEDGFPIESSVTGETTEPTVPDDIKLPFTVSGKTITLDPDGLGETMTFTKK